MKNGEKRRNPKRTQIDYILIDKKHLRFVKDSRSFNNIHTDTDHNMVLMSINLDLSRLNSARKPPIPEINTDNFKKPDYVDKYRQKVAELDSNADETECKTNDDRWSKINNTCKAAGKEILGTKEKFKQKPEDHEIQNLKEERHRLKVKIDGCNSTELRKKFESRRRNIQKEITSKLKAAEERELDQKMKHLESLKDDNTKYYYVMRDIQSINRNRKTSIIVKDPEGNVPGSTEDKIKIIQQYFKDTLAPEEMKTEYLTVPPCAMTKEFTASGIQLIAKKLNNDKAAGPDKLKAEFIKYAPMSTYEQIATIFNSTAATGDEPKALTHGLLHPVPKPGKKKGPPENLRPIILLSILRKILTIALLNRIWERLSTRIPKAQAAYQKGRGTTEQVLALKLLIDKAITSTDYDIYILLLDMSTAFDTDNRKNLMNDE